MLFAYFGPETVLPLTSVVAAVVGVLMMFGQRALHLAKWAIRRAMGGRRGAPARWTLDRDHRRDAPEPAETRHPIHQTERARS